MLKHCNRVGVLFATATCSSSPQSVVSLRPTLTLSAQLERRLKHDYWVPKDAWDLTPLVDEENETVWERQLRMDRETPEKWQFYEQVVWPPNYVDENGNRKKAEVFHCMEDVKYSPKKMWTMCHFIRGMSVDEALVQLQFIPRKGSRILTDLLKGAKEKAATAEVGIEFPSHTWIAECFPIQSRIITGARYHARRFYLAPMSYRYVNVFVRLEEGSPPAYSSRDPVPTGWDKMRRHVEYLRSRRFGDAL